MIYPFYVILSFLNFEFGWRKTMTRLVLAFILTFAFQTLFADVLIIDEVRQSDRLELPKNGLNKITVEAKFGHRLKNCRQ